MSNFYPTLYNGWHCLVMLELKLIHVSKKGPRYVYPLCLRLVWLFSGHSEYALSQWEITLQCNVVSHWPSPYPNVSLLFKCSFPGAWWRHQMETFSALLAICAGNSPVPGEFPTQRPVTRSFDVFFDLRLNTRLSKQSWGWWFETL